MRPANSIVLGLPDARGTRANANHNDAAFLAITSDVAGFYTNLTGGPTCQQIASENGIRIVAK